MSTTKGIKFIDPLEGLTKPVSSSETWKPNNLKISLFTGMPHDQVLKLREQEKLNNVNGSK